MNNKAVPERCDLTLMSGSICLTLNVVLDPVNIFHDGSTRTELKSRSGLKLAEWIKKSVLLWADGRDVSALLFPCSVVKTRKKRPGASSYARLACITGCCYNWGVHCGHANYFHRCCHWQHLRLWPHQILKKKKKAQPTELRPRGLSYEVAWRRDVFTVNWGFAAHCVALYLFMPSP